MTFEEKLRRKQGLATTVARSHEDNVAVIKVIVDAYLGNFGMERASRTRDNWEHVMGVPMDFEQYRYRIYEGE